MAFTVGELVAKLKADTRQFDAAMVGAEQKIQKLGTAAAKADTGVRRAASGTSAYANAQRLSTAEIRAAEQAYSGQGKAAAGAASAMTASRAAMLAADAKWERAQVLMHMQALKMNEAFDAGAVTSRRAGVGLSHMSNAMRSVAVQMSGVNPLAGRLLGSIGQFAVGSGIMIGVFAGLAGIAALWRKIGEDARTARERTDGLVASLIKAADTRRGLATAEASVAADENVARIQKEIDDPLTMKWTPRYWRLQAELSVARGAQIEANRQVEEQERETQTDAIGHMNVVIREKMAILARELEVLDLRMEVVIR